MQLEYLNEKVEEKREFLMDTERNFHVDKSRRSGLKLLKIYLESKDRSGNSVWTNYFNLNFESQLRANSVMVCMVWQFNLVESL